VHNCSSHCSYTVYIHLRLPPHRDEKNKRTNLVSFFSPRHKLGMHRTDLHISTVPVSGLQYSTSPSLPTAVKTLGITRDTSCFYSYASLNASPVEPPGPLPQSTLDLYDRFYSSLPGTEPARYHSSSHSGKDKSEASRDGDCAPSQQSWSASLTLPDTLSCIGPSARRLLQLDAAQRKEKAALHNELESRGTKLRATTTHSSTVPAAATAAAASRSTALAPSSFAGQHVTHLPIVPAAARTLPVYSGKSKSMSSRPAHLAKGVKYTATTTTAPPTVDRHSAGVTSSAQPPSDLDRAAFSSPATFDVRPPLLSSTITNGRVSGGGGTGNVARGAEVAAPPLVTELQAYIQRELVRNTNAAVAPSAMEQLGPYREAFRALCSTFPSYASLLSDIQSAYDNVIQAQAELLTDAYATMTLRDVERSTNQDLVTTLHDQVNDLQEELRRMEEKLETRVLAEEEDRQHTVRQQPRSAQLTDAVDLRRELDAARERIRELERNSQGDLEKIVILIGAVRECDRRLKEYERIVAGVTGQVSELDEFKRIAGEAQAELQLFRSKYADYVPVTDFQLMKEYLANELEAAQLLTRRWRRTAAVRGTQLDVMQRRLATLEEENASFVRAAEAAEGTASPSQLRVPLTPRPSWAKLHAELPELAEYAADVGALTTVNDQNDDTPPMATGGGKLLPTVTGPKETSLQVEYLVKRVCTLENQLRALQQQQQQQAPSKQTSVQFTGGEASTSLRAGSIVSNSPLTSLDNTEGKDRSSTLAKPTTTATTTAAAKPEAGTFARRSSRRGHHRFSEGFQASPSGMHGGVPMPALAPPLTLPLVGLGYGPDVPVYLRASGIVPRRPVPPSTIVSLVFHFFLDVLPPYMDQQDELRRSGEETAKGNGDPIGACLYEYLQSEMTTREDLRGYDSVPHLMMNLMRDGEGNEWFSDALHVLLWTVQGVLPPRVAVDAAIVVAQVRRDVRALAKEMQSSRLRRQALSECLQPVLELKSASEISELRAALGSETTFNVDILCSDTHPFMEVLLVQECRASAELYVSFLSALSARATTMGVHRAASANSKGVRGLKTTDASPQPQPKLEEGDRVVTLADVAAAIQEVEPQTPEIVVRELSFNAATASGKQNLLKPSASPAAVAGQSSVNVVDGIGTNKAVQSAEEACVVVRLSDIIRAIAAAPLIRRSQQNNPDGCVL
jgi:hypothetical protein